jgi:hypothetical protein
MTPIFITLAFQLGFFQRNQPPKYTSATQADDAPPVAQPSFQMNTIGKD